MLPLSLSSKHNIKPRCEISLSLQGSEHTRSQEFRLRAAGPKSKCPITQSYAKIRSNCLLESRYGFPSDWDNNVLVAFAVACNSLRGFH